MVWQRRKASVVVQLHMLLGGVHRDRHDVGGRRLSNKERVECKGTSVSGGASVGGMRMRTKICVPCLA